MRQFGCLFALFVLATSAGMPARSTAQTKDAKANAPKLVAPAKDGTLPADARTPALQPAAKPLAKPAEPPARQSPSAPASTLAPPASSTNIGRGEHVIYIPYSKLADVFEKDARNVLMPFAEYQQLWEAVRKLGSTTIKPPLPAVISSLDYSGRVEGDLARLRAKLVVDVLADEWLKLPLAMRGAAISNVEGGMLAAASADNYLLLLKNRGRHVVSFDVTAPIVRSADGRKLSLHGPAAGGTTLDLTVPEANVDFDVTPKLAAPTIEAKPGATRLLATLGAVDAVQVSWRAKTELAATAPLVVAQTVIRVDVGEGVIRTQTNIDYQLLRGELAQLAFTLPASERLLDVQIPGMRDWKASGAGATRRVDVRLHAPLKQRSIMRIESERPLGAGKFAVGEIRPLGVDRQTGILALLSSDEVNLAAADRKAVTRVSPADAPAELQKPNGLYYKFYAGDYAMTAEASAVVPRVAVVQQLLTRLEEGRLRIDARLAYDVQRAGIFSVRIRLPAGMDLEEVSSPALERHEVVNEAAGPIVNVQLKQRTVGVFEIRLLASALRGEVGASADGVAVKADAVKSSTFSLPIPEPLEAHSERGFIAFLAHESFEINADPSRTKGVRPTTPAEMAAAGFALRPEPRMTLAASYRYLSRPIEAAFAVKRRTTRIVVDSFTKLFVRENALLTRTVLAYTVQYSGTDALELLVPDNVADKVEINGANIKEKKRGPSVDGWTPWTVLLHTRTLGRHALIASFEEPLKLNETGTSRADIAAKLVRAGNVERENGQIAVVKERSLSLEDKVENLEPTDPRQLSAPTEIVAGDARDAAEVQLGYRYYRHPVKLTLSATKHEIQRVVETVVARTLIDSVIPESGPITHRVLFSAKSSQRQRLRLQFPPGSRILGVQVAGRTAQPEKDPKAAGEEYLINVSRSTGVDEVFPIAVVFEQSRAAGKLETATFAPFAMPRVELAVPKFAGDVSQQRLYWRAWLPKRFAAVGVPTGFTDDGALYRPLYEGVGVDAAYNAEVERWLQDWGQVNAQSVFEFTTVGRKYAYSSLIGHDRLPLQYGHVPAMIAAASLAALFVMVFTIRLRLERKLTLLLLAATATALAGLYWPDAVFRWLAAAEIGIGAGLVLWIGHDIIRGRREQAARRRAHFEKMSILQHQEQHLAQAAHMSAQRPPNGDDAAESARPEGQ